MQAKRSLWFSGLFVSACATSAVGPMDDVDSSVQPNQAAQDASTFADAYVPGPKSPEREAGVPEASTAGGDAALPGRDADVPTDEPDADLPPEPDAALPRVAPLIDGKITAGEWAHAEVVTQSQASNWGVGKNELGALYAVIEGDSLYMAVSGVVEAQNALVVYLDAQVGIGAVPSALTDVTGALDNAISAAISVPAGVDIDFAWGTRSMSRSATGFDDVTGVRDLTLANNFAWIDATTVAPVVCGTGACEARIPLSTLGISRSELKIFARIVTAQGTEVCNQTLPFDAPAAPAAVTTFLTLSLPE